MKLFGWKSAGREDSRPVLSRVGSWHGSGGNGGDWGGGYEAQVRAAYLGNVIAQRAVRLVADGLGEAPLRTSSDEIGRLVRVRSGGQALLATLAAQVLLHGNRHSGWIASGWPGSRSGRRGVRMISPAAMRCAAARRATCVR